MRSGIPDEEVELDLTNSHLHGLGEVEIRPTLEVFFVCVYFASEQAWSPGCRRTKWFCVQYVDLTANRLKAIEERILSLKGTPTI